MATHNTYLSCLSLKSTCEQSSISNLLVQYIKIISDKVMVWIYKAIKMTSLKTVLNWEASLKCKLEKELTSGKVARKKCVICAKYESWIKNIKGFSTSWITGTLSVKKDSLEKHLSGKHHKKAKELDTKELLGPEKYQSEVVLTSATEQGIKKMNETDKEVSFLHVIKACVCYFSSNFSFFINIS